MLSYPSLPLYLWEEAFDLWVSWVWLISLSRICYLLSSGRPFSFCSVHDFMQIPLPQASLINISISPFPLEARLPVHIPSVSLLSPPKIAVKMSFISTLPFIVNPSSTLGHTLCPPLSCHLIASNGNDIMHWYQNSASQRTCYNFM